MAVKVVIAGGVAGGASCAARLRRLDESAEIVMFERGPFISYANCGLPYHIGGVITERSSLLVQTVERFRSVYRVDVRTRAEVVSIDRDNGQVEVREAVDDTGESRVYWEGYDYLVLAPGAEPIRPPFPGVDMPGIFSLRSLSDMDAIIAWIGSRLPKKAVVIGGGYIGLEVAENLKHRDIEVAVVEKTGQVMLPLDGEMANIIHQHLRARGVAVWLGRGVKSFAQRGHDGKGIAVTLEDGTALPADMVILSIGVRPDVKLAKAAGIELGTTGGIKVDARLRTSDEKIYAVGDAIEVKNFVTGKPALFPLAGPANRQGRIAADNIAASCGSVGRAGRASTYKGTQGTSIVKVFDLVAAVTGPNERTLKAAGIAFDKIYIHPADHAGYYPNASQMSIKALFAPDDGRLLGAQIIGPRGVDKRVDVLATAIRARMSVYDLEELELAYAPPFGSAKDAVNMVGFVAADQLEGMVRFAYWQDIDSPVADNVTLLDVRSPAEWDAGHVPGARLIPLNELRSRLAEIPRDKEVLAYCGVGIRSYAAARILAQAGFNTRSVAGGYKSFAAAHPELTPAGAADSMFRELQERFLTPEIEPPLTLEEGQHTA